jgi:hypothetical protein
MTLGLVTEPVEVTKPVVVVALLALDRGLDLQLAATCWKPIHVTVEVLV